MPTDDHLVDEQAIIRAAQSGDARAFETLVERYKDMVVNTCFGFLQSREDADDVAQEVFIEVYRALDRFRGDAKFSTWLYRIAVNRALNALKKRKRRQWIGSLQQLLGRREPPPQFEDTETPDPQADLEQQERLQMLHSAIDQLPETQKIAFTLNKYEDLSYAEVAEVLGTTVSAVESLLVRAKQNLRKTLERKYRQQ